MNNKAYLGDSVYIELDKYLGIILTTENGFGPTNTIVLEYEVLQRLLDYCFQRGVIKQPLKEE